MSSRTIAAAVAVLAILALSAPAARAQASTGDDVFLDPERLVRGLYAAVSFDPGPGPDWERVKRFFLPQAVLGVRMTPTSMAVLNVQQFVDWFIGDVEKFKMKERGFEETVVKLRLTAFGDMAHAFVVYKARLKTPATAPGQYGLDSWELMKKDGRWWIVGMTNDVVLRGRALPEELKIDGM